MESVTTGSYVTYKDVPHIIVADDGNWVKILNPLKGQAKLQVKRHNVRPMAIQPAEVIEYQDRMFLVTLKETIISLTSGRVVFTNPNNGNRKAILFFAAAQYYLD